MTLKETLLKEFSLNDNYISRSRLYDIARYSRCDFDTLRRLLHDKIPGVITEKEKHITGWRYIAPESPKIAHTDVLPQNTSQSPLFKLEPLKAIKKRHYEFD